MRIAFLGPAYPWRGGIAKFADNLAEKLSGAGHELMMFTYIQQYPAFLFPSSGQMVSEIEKSDIPVQKTLIPYLPHTWLQTVNSIKGWNPDIVIVSYWIPFMAPCIGFIIRRLKNTIKIGLLHNIQFHEKWLFADRLTSYALGPFDYYITLSEVTTKALKESKIPIPDHKVIMLFHPVYENLRVDANNINRITNNLLFFGFIKPYKGLDILLRAFALVLKTLPDKRLVIAGDVYGDKKQYFDIIDDLGIHNNVEVSFRYIAEYEIEEIFNNSDVCIIPYRTATQSGVAQMSYAHLVPVIATDVGGISEVVKENETGLLVEAGNHVQLAEKITEYYHQNYKSKFIENIENVNREHSWDSFASKLISAIK